MSPVEEQKTVRCIVFQTSPLVWDSACYPMHKVPVSDNYFCESVS